MLIGEIGGMAEEEAACWVAGNVREKPVVSPSSPGRRRRPGGAWGTPARSSPAGSGTAADKMKALEAAGIARREEPG